MDKRTNARYNALRQVMLTLKNNQEKYKSISMLVKTVLDLEQRVLKIESLIEKRQSIPRKPSGNKNLAQQELVDAAHQVGSVLKAYAFISKKQNIRTYLITSKSELSEKLPQLRLLDYAKNLLELIKPIFKELQEFGLTQEMKHELKLKIHQFEKLMTEPRQLISERHTTILMLKVEIAEAYQILKNQVDPLMELLKEDKEFYLSYKSARMIVDPATRKRVGKEL
ncbi:hypothetical protein [Ancylomarina longa]|uniref:Uncharacterized protein n=1 Tax=Ancylomarina longa TaxID=2487017 RepID=A0A434AU97_9BACT|nr:hypothetical protein [Ancylomarina longa]RUT77990.1 hypothetical protein DLK05_10080 [Ancylomarina longa]